MAYDRITNEWTGNITARVREEELEYGFVHTIHRELQQVGTDKDKVISDTKMQRQDSER